MSFRLRSTADTEVGPASGLGRHMVLVQTIRLEADLLVPGELRMWARLMKRRISEHANFGTCLSKNVRIASIYTGEGIEEETRMPSWDYIESRGATNLEGMTKPDDMYAETMEEMEDVLVLEIPRPRINLDHL